ncbi:MAG TPA: DEAD/DEAH box helicase family protein [Rickettsiales bacterium]|nr:DEAD/DEAH box helicase family protein [Rickettsiales bacterium]
MRQQDKDKILGNLHNFLVKESRTSDDKKALRPHQFEALQSVEDFLRLEDGAEFIQGGREPPEEGASEQPPVTGTKEGDFFEVVSATGSGKTRMFGTMAKAMDVPALILTPRNVLNAQTLHELCQEVGISESDVAIYDSKQGINTIRSILDSENPPKFVIASYQGLPSLAGKLGLATPGDPHYRPLWILDEVHEAQGPETSGQLNAYQDQVIMAGFTATDAGASQTLFNGQKPIYNLPLVGAIRRGGILCDGIRTGVIDIATDQELVASFNRTPRGRNYAQQDIEKFTSASAVIEKVVNFHLNHVDKELGKISRLPTIFYTQGVKAAADGAKEFNRQARALGLDVKAAWVSGEKSEFTYYDNAEKREITITDRDEILKRFRNGEIQAIWNDKLLGMGFDAPNATVCYSMQLNVPYVAEQQLGRVGRKEKEDYFEKYLRNQSTLQSKVGLAINVRAAGTNPYLYAQVLEGPSLHSRKDRVKASRAEGGGEPVERPQLPQGMTLHLGYEEMSAVLADANRRRAILPDPPAGWLHRTNMAAATGRKVSTISGLYNALEAAWAEAGDAETFEARGITLRTNQVGFFRSATGESTFYVDGEAASLFAHNFPPKSAKMLNIKEMAAASNRATETISGLYAALRKAWEKAGDNEYFEAEGIRLRTNQAGVFKLGPVPAFCVHQDAASLFRSNFPEKTDEWLNKAEMRAATKGKYTIVAAVYDAMETAWKAAKEAGDNEFEAMGIRLRTDQAGVFQSNNGKNISFCIHKDAADKFKSPSPEKRTSDWLIKNEMRRTIGSSDPVIDRFYKAVQAAWEVAGDNEYFEVAGIRLRTDQCKTFGSTFCIHVDAVETIRDNKHLLLTIPKPPSAAVEPKSIKPGSPDLDSADRTRGASDE